MTTRLNRAATSRKKNYNYMQATDTPPPPPGIEYRWGRREIHGQPDDKNMYTHLRNGWVPVTPDELTKTHPDWPTMSDKWKDKAVVTAGSDLILLKNTTEKVAEENEYFAERTRQQEDSASRADVMRQQMSDKKYGGVNVTNSNRVKIGNPDESTDDSRDF